MTVDLNDIALFVQVVSAGSFAGAARHLGIPPNTASRRIQALEQRLNVRLLHRSTRKLTLTTAGEALFERSKTHVEALAHSVQETVDDGQSPGGIVRIAAPVDFFSLFTLEWIAEFLALHPRVSLDFQFSDARADLISESIDLAFRAGDVPEPTLVKRVVGNSRLWLVAGRGYIDKRGQPATLEELSAHDCVVLRARDGKGTWQLDGPSGQAQAEIRARLSANTMQAVISATLAGIGIALIPLIGMVEHISAGTLVRVLDQYQVEGSDIHLVYSSRRHQPKGVRAFIDFAMTKIPLGGSE